MFLFRYFAICHSLAIVISRKMCKLIILCIWIAAVVILIPWAIYYRYSEYKTSLQVVPLCYEKWPSLKAKLAYFLGAIFLCCYTIPLIFILVCYIMIGLRVWRREAPGEQNDSSEVVHRSKVKVVKMLAVVVVLFAFSWLPLYAIGLRQMLDGESDSESTQRVVWDIIFPIAQWLGSSNSGVNPIIYCFFSRRYRRGFKEILTCCPRRHDEIRHYTESTNVSVGYTNGKYRMYSNRKAAGAIKPMSRNASQSSV